MHKIAIITVFFTLSLVRPVLLLAGTSYAISPTTAYDLSSPYLALGISGVISVGYSNAVEAGPDNSGDGGTSLKLGGLGLLADGEMTGIEWSKSGTGYLVFDWKVSSEDGYDVLRFYEVGSLETNSISGTAGGWTRHSALVIGTVDDVHTFRWEYAKDESEYVGMDCGWVDAIQWHPAYVLTINNGFGDGFYTNASSATITADVPLHMDFDYWTGDTNAVSNIYASSATLIMPATNIFLTAVFKPSLYALNVVKGSGDGSYVYQSVVEIRADSFDGKRFYRWIGDTDGVVDVSSPTTTVTTIGSEMALTATYCVPLSVNSGTGTGWYPEGSIANIVAAADPMWEEFAAWVGDIGSISNLNSRTTTVTLPEGSVTVAATYKDSISRLTGSYGRIYSESGTANAITSDGNAGSPSGTPAIKIGGAGVISDNGFAAFETVVSGSGSITFWWKASSESNADYLKFKVDGVEVAAISGTKGPWTQVSNRVDTVGTHTLRWEYLKNGSLSSSTDAGWVDDIVWAGDIPVPALTPVIVQATLTNQDLSIQFTGERGISYLVRTNGTLSRAGWSDYQTLKPVWINESNGVHRFEITPSASDPDKLFYRIATPLCMVVIPAGTNSGTDPDNGAYSLTVDAFFMDATEVTKAKWDEVYIWAVAHGYSFTNAGLGKASSHPVHTVNWYDCVKWCNARSQKEGKTPCYNLSNWSCNSSANGYRLPTMAEWEYAARGGLSGKRFPWGDTIDHSRANYRGDPSTYMYDSGYVGFDTLYATGDYPYTSPTGSFSPNGYGLYDMAGNLSEWCNDVVGSARGCRGGLWASDAYGVRCRRSGLGIADRAYDEIGFRTICR